MSDPTDLVTCASATRPAMPTPDTIVREVDTGRALRWTGTEWVDDIVAWVEWAFDRAEQRALAAATWGYPNFVNGRPIGPVVSRDERDVWTVRENENHPYQMMIVTAPESPDRPLEYPLAELVDAQFNDPAAVGRHMTDHDPKWRLADIARKRKILAKHDDQHDCGDPRSWEYPHVGCTTVRLLAAEFDSEPGYQEAWRR